MLSRIISAAVYGVDAFRVEVEVDLARGLPNFSTVGLAEGAVKESRVRVESALKNSGLEFPQKRITVNLAPADIRKAGTAFDLPIALGLVASYHAFENGILSKTLVVGELGLNGEVRRIPGVLNMAVMAKAQGLSHIICPLDCAQEAAAVGGIEVLPVSHFQEVLSHFKGEQALSPCLSDLQLFDQPPEPDAPDMQEVKGQQHAKRALEVAAAGGHHLLMIGPPGSGKTMLARRLASILPPLSYDEALETTKVYSVSGQLPAGKALVVTRPFRAPHHTISDAGLVGGGSMPKPGEVSLAHHGVLFLDELPEFRRHVLDVLRQPLEDNLVTIARAQITVAFPAKIMLVAAMNPCPCGYLTDPKRLCWCTAQAIQRYRNRISGPLLDRIDIQLEVPAISYDELMTRNQGVSSEEIRKRVVQSREIQQKRFSAYRQIRCNSQMTPRLVQRHCSLEKSCQKLLEHAVVQLGFSARAIERILKVARTIADLEGSDPIKVPHLAEAIQYRNLDRESGNGNPTSRN